MNTQKLNRKLKQRSKWQWLLISLFLFARHYDRSLLGISPPVLPANQWVPVLSASCVRKMKWFSKGPEQGKSGAGAWTILSVLASVLVKSVSTAGWPYLILVSHLTFHSPPLTLQHIQEFTTESYLCPFVLWLLRLLKEKDSCTGNIIVSKRKSTLPLNYMWFQFGIFESDSYLYFVTF